jgi:hypothetical protein
LDYVAFVDVCLVSLMVLSVYYILESNAETYMQSIHGHLVIAGYTCNMAPLFQSVYSDYAITLGQFFTPLDLIEDPNVFSVKFAQVN